MALIKCPECGKWFQDEAPACPYCGCPTEVAKKHQENQEEEKKKETHLKKKSPFFLLLFILIPIAVIALFAFLFRGAGSDQPAQKETPVKEKTETDTDTGTLVYEDIFGSGLFWNISKDTLKGLYDADFTSKQDTDKTTYLRTSLSNADPFTYDADSCFGFSSQDALILAGLSETDINNTTESSSIVLRDADQYKKTLDSLYKSNRTFLSGEAATASYWDTEKGTLIFQYRIWPGGSQSSRGVHALLFVPGNIRTAKDTITRANRVMHMEYGVSQNLLGGSEDASDSSKWSAIFSKENGMLTTHVKWNMDQDQVEALYTGGFSTKTKDNTTYIMATVEKSDPFSLDTDLMVGFGSDGKMSFVCVREEDSESVSQKDSETLQDAESYASYLSDTYKRKEEIVSGKQNTGASYNTNLGTIIVQYSIWLTGDKEGTVKGTHLILFLPGGTSANLQGAGIWNALDIIHDEYGIANDLLGTEQFTAVETPNPTAEPIETPTQTAKPTSTPETEEIKIESDHFEATPDQMITFLQKVIPNLQITNANQDISNDGHSIPVYKITNTDDSLGFLGLKVLDNGNVEGILIYANNNDTALVDTVSIACHLDPSLDTGNNLMGHLYSGERQYSDYLTISYSAPKGGPYIAGILPKGVGDDIFDGTYNQ